MTAKADRVNDKVRESFCTHFACRLPDTNEVGLFAGQRAVDLARVDDDTGQ